MNEMLEPNQYFSQVVLGKLKLAQEWCLLVGKERHPNDNAASSNSSLPGQLGGLIALRVDSLWRQVRKLCLDWLKWQFGVA